MRRVRDDLLWRSIFTFAPFSHDRIAALRLQETYQDFHPDDLLLLPGVCVKASYTQGNGFAFHGRLVKFMGDDLRIELPEKKVITEDVVVISTLDQDTVWLGGVNQYFDMWCVD